MNVAAEQNALADVLMYKEIETAEAAIARAQELAAVGQIGRALSLADFAFNISGDWLVGLRARSIPGLLPFTLGGVHQVSRFWEDQHRKYAELSDTPGLADQVSQFRQELPRPTLEDTILWSPIEDTISFDDLNDKAEALRLRGGALMHHPRLFALADIVRDVCPEDPALVMGLLHRLPNAEGAPLHVKLESPYAPMISTGVWQASPRFRKDILQAFHVDDPWDAHFDAHAACFARAVRDAKRPQ